MMKKICRIHPISVFCCFVLWMTAFFLPAHEYLYADTAKEYTVKAAFILNFGRFATWPDTSFQGDEEPYRLCVIGKRNLEPSFQTVSGEKIGSRELTVRFQDVSEDVGFCHMVFIGRSVAASDVSRILASVKGKPILTIGEKKDFTEKGGMISFFTKNERLYFEVNMDIVRQQNVKLSSRLLKLAIIVGDI